MNEILKQKYKSVWQTTLRLHAYNLCWFIVYKSNSYPSLSHLVSGHSHIPARSGLPILLLMNSSGANPSRSSHSGVYPASGAVLSGASRVDWRCVLKDDCLLGANAATEYRRDAAITSFMFKECCQFVVLNWQCMIYDISRRSCRWEGGEVEVLNVSSLSFWLFGGYLPYLQLVSSNIKIDFINLIEEWARLKQWGKALKIVISKM